TPHSPWEPKQDLPMKNWDKRSNLDIGDQHSNFPELGFLEASGWFPLQFPPIPFASKQTLRTGIGNQLKLNEHKKSSISILHPNVSS
ncbi:hypothetical protein ACJX0J_037640, partial [Zea mays]